jgi:hypothetical protein
MAHGSSRHEAAQYGDMAKRPSRLKEHRDSAAKLLKQSRRSDYASIRGSLSKTAAAHKALAHEEEIERGEVTTIAKNVRPKNPSLQVRMPYRGTFRNLREGTGAPTDSAEPRASTHRICHADHTGGAASSGSDRFPKYIGVRRNSDLRSGLLRALWGARFGLWKRSSSKSSAPRSRLVR